MPSIMFKNITEKIAPELIIDEEFANLIPPLTPDEFSGLEQSILSEGCRDPIITWNDIIIDGHNRYRICKTHGLPYRREARDFSSRDDVILWMLRNQLSRRNLNDFQRIEMVRKCEDAVKAQAEKRRLANLKQNTDMENLPDRATSRDALGAMAGVSGKTYEHATAVLDNAPEPVIDATRKKELSINAAYDITRMDAEKQQEIAERISNGETPSKVVSEVKKKPATSGYWDKIIKNAEKAVKDGKDVERIIDIVSEALRILKRE